VCSNIPSLCEAVGNAALLFNSEDPAAIAAALERILQDKKLRINLKDQGFRRAAELPWRLAAEKTMSLYKRVASQATPIR
jgi:glycosyltransferase involved in cell wall biosynthesis